MVSRAAAYHSGFNFGFNIAEAVNFALIRWIEIAQRANSCTCVNDSVRINMSYFFNNIIKDGNLIANLKKRFGRNPGLKLTNGSGEEEEKDEETLEETFLNLKSLSNKNTPASIF